MTPEGLFTLLSDETRLRSLVLLKEAGELCVCELSHILATQQPKVSRHLGLLRTSGLVLDERRGQWVYYRLNAHSEKWVETLLEAILGSLKKLDPYRKDIKKVQAIRKGEGIC